eukprot:XP_001698142.1 predicted protein [Chlamydomonas reinhardtii]
MNSTLNRRLAQTSTGVALLPCPRLHRLQTVSHSPIQAAAPCPARAAEQLPSLTSSRAVAAAAGRQAEAASATNDRKRTRLAADKSPELIDPQLLAPIPMPTEYQQTLWASFTIAGVGLHSGEYAVVRVRPAFAGEGRYFVRVPEGTNAARGEESLVRMLEAGAGKQPEEEEAMDDTATREYKRELIAAYQEYVDAQEDDGFNGTFADYMNGKSYVALLQRLREEGPPRFSFSEAEAPQPRGEDEPYVEAALANITEPNPFTTALAKGDVEVLGVEALLSALEACGVDNARIEIEGGAEVPVIDGSAGGWASQIQTSGLTHALPRDDLPVPGGEFPAPADGEEAAAGDAEARKQRVCKMVVSVQRGASFVTLYPEDTFRLTVGLDRHLEAPVIGKQWFSWCMFEDLHYMHSLADARSNGDSWYDHTIVRHPRDEPARHQMQDLIGPSVATDYEELLGSLLEGDEGEDDEGEGGEGAQLADQGPAIPRPQEAPQSQPSRQQHGLLALPNDVLAKIADTALRCGSGTALTAACRDLRDATQAALHASPCLRLKLGMVNPGMQGMAGMQGMQPAQPVNSMGMMGMQGAGGMPGMSNGVMSTMGMAGLGAPGGMHPGAGGMPGEKNRKAQRRFRERQKTKLLELHKQIEELTGKVSNLQTENAALHSRTSILEKVLDMRNEQIQVMQENKEVSEAELAGLGPGQALVPLTPEAIKEMSSEDIYRVYQTYVKELSVSELSVADAAAMSDLERVVRELSVMLMRLGVARPLEARKFIVFSRQYLGNTEREVIELWKSKHIELTPEQMREIVELKRMFLTKIEPIMEERKHLNISIQTNLPHDTYHTKSSISYIKAHEAVSKLRDNLRSEQHVVLEFAIAVFRGVFRPQQMATLLVRCYPAVPDALGIASALAAELGEPDSPATQQLAMQLGGYAVPGAQPSTSGSAGAPPLGSIHPSLARPPNRCTA